MTHAELYNIVKDHQDVWGKQLEWDGFQFIRRIGDAVYSLPGLRGTRGTEMELLGLGVEWLVENEKQSRIYAKGLCCTGFGTMTNGRWLGQGDSIIASVYSLIDRLKTNRAAIAEVKRG